VGAGETGGTRTTDSWIFCHKCARKIWMSEILSVGSLPCMKNAREVQLHLEAQRTRWRG
jgi:hypothetical protein